MRALFNKIFGSTINENKNEGEAAVFPTEKFAVFEGRLVDGRPAVGSFNMAYSNYSYRERFPWCLKLSIGLDEDNLYENGLPLAEESSVANRMEDELVAKMQSLAATHYIGHLSNDSFLDVYVHLADPEPVHKMLQNLIESGDHVRGFGYEISKDPEWQTVGQFLT